MDPQELRYMVEEQLDHNLVGHNFVLGILVEVGLVVDILEEMSIAVDILVMGIHLEEELVVHILELDILEDIE
eukprot:CAMPEP_0182419588 /NCGR_PEP_ID=MMETSP1167-20130531/4006_1 /TAXON_ID=2988 /ORGANISM="Mallomonas Sp, Strain CCMP3275" /LENGTH=72 /DNA_ID=CAMNT_0024594581 /DNA_START=817 /DNA_END=1035 /DNA_ORIENTATION=-